jgi:hypothetical protein
LFWTATPRESGCRGVLLAAWRMLTPAARLVPNVFPLTRMS